MTQITTPDFTQSFDASPVAEGPLHGVRVGIKDLFDVAGYVTKAGSRARANLPPAPQDAEAVARLRAAGAALVGHTNMTEFAYSGLGLNPHFGTPMTPLIDGAIAGGSTSGGASALARGDIDLALGTDTGGSLRIPAAFCGVVGFKPTAASVSSVGAVALSHTLDSVGPMARDVAMVRRAYDVLSDGNGQDAAPLGDLIVPDNFGMDQLDAAVEDAFGAAIEQVAAQGFRVVRKHLDFLDAYAGLPVWHFSAVESRVHHRVAYEDQPELLDPRVRARMTRADTVSAVEYATSLVQRAAIAAAAAQELGNAAILLPSVAILPPQLDDLADAASFDRINLLALRNTSLGNVIDGCSISLPIAGTPGAGLMLTAPGGRDRVLLDAAATIEPALSL